MTKREEIKKLVSDSKELSDKINELNDKMYIIDDMMYSLVKEILLEEDILAGTEWKLRITRSGIAISLEFIGSREAMKPIQELVFWTDYNCTIDFEPGVNISIGDTSIIISFNNVKKIPSYIKTLKLNVNTDSLKNSLAIVKKESLDLEIVCHQLQIPL